MTENVHEETARNRKAADLWERLRDAHPEVPPTDDEIAACAAEHGIRPPSTATCDRVRELAAVTHRVNARPVADILDAF